MAAMDVYGDASAPSRCLAEVEGAIERILHQSFVEVGSLLLEIRAGKLYRETHGSFEEYCRERWGWSRQRAHQMIEASSVSAIVDTAPTNEAQARELARLKHDPEAVREVWGEVQTATGGKPTASIVRQFVSKRLEAEAAERLPAEERDRAVALASQAGASPDDAMRVLAGLADKPAEVRAEILARAASPDERDRMAALTDAAGLPPMPDPRMQELIRIAGQVRLVARRFPNDPLNGDILAAADQLDALAARALEVKRGTHS